MSKKTALLRHLCESTGTKNKAENLVKSRLSALFVASPPGFEPGASGLGGSRSILLSYGDNYKILCVLPLAFFEKASDKVQP